MDPNGMIIFVIVGVSRKTSCTLARIQWDPKVVVMVLVHVLVGPENKKWIGHLQSHRPDNGPFEDVYSYKEKMNIFWLLY